MAMTFEWLFDLFMQLGVFVLITLVPIFFCISYLFIIRDEKRKGVKKCRTGFSKLCTVIGLDLCGIGMVAFIGWFEYVAYAEGLMLNVLK